MDKIKEIANFMIAHGTERTATSNYCFYGYDLMKMFNFDEQYLDDNQESIIDELWNREEVLDVEYNDCFDIIFGTSFCPNLDS